MKKKLNSKARDYAINGKSQSQVVPKSSHSQVTVMTNSNKGPGSRLRSDLSGGERVKVVVRVRPMSAMEAGRGDQYVCDVIDEHHIQ